MRSRALIVARAGVLAGPVAVAFATGGYFDDGRLWALIGAWTLFASAVLLGAPVLPRGAAGRAAIAGLAAYAGWIWLSERWSPLPASAGSDAQRAILYVGALLAAAALLRPRAVARAAEPLLALGALVVVGYGLLGKAGIIHVHHSVSAGGRLEQPLSYWNAMGALAAIGLVLCVRVAVDGTRATALRVPAGIAALPLAAGLYLSYSRGAIVAAVAGLIVLFVAVPRRRPLPRWAAPVAAVVSLAIVVVPVLVARGSSEGQPAFGATSARLTSVGSNRYAYWKVAVRTGAHHPLGGIGASGFAVEWLERRTIDDPARDAHSLELETFAELGLAGLALLAAWLAAIAVAARRLHGADPALAAGPIAALAVWALHSAIDWDWEMPGLTLFAVVLAGLVVARSGEAR